MSTVAIGGISIGEPDKCLLAPVSMIRQGDKICEVRLSMPNAVRITSPRPDRVEAAASNAKCRRTSRISRLKVTPVAKELISHAPANLKRSKA